MKIFFLSCVIFFSLTNNSYGFPLAILVVSTELFFLFWGIISSIVISIFLYFRRLRFIEKIGVSAIVILSGIIGYSIIVDVVKQNSIESYLRDTQQIARIKSLDIYYDNHKKLLNNYDKSLKYNYYIKNKNNYFVIDVREVSELISNPSIFTSYRLPEIINHHKAYFENTDKKILVTCINGNRGRIVSSILGSLGYDSYYLEGGLSNFTNIDTHQSKVVSKCRNTQGEKEIYVGVKKPLEGKDIAYMQLTYDEIQERINHLNFPKNTSIALTCDPKKILNCGVGRQSLALLLHKQGYKNICIKN